jgi:hypothetical protein
MSKDDGQDGQEPRNPKQAPPGYKVGPKNPPYESRWCKGDPSPNPGGRPPKKHLKSFLAKLDPLAAQVAEFDQQGTGVIGADGNETTRGASFLAGVYLQSQKNPRYAELYEKIRSLAYAEIRKLNEEALEAAIYHRRRYLADFLSAERRGSLLPDVLPDPRDLIIDAKGELKIVGPLDRQEYETMRAAVKLRDEFFKGLKLVEESDAPQAAITSARNYIRRRIYRLNKLIPPRLRKRIPAANSNRD